MQNKQIKFQLEHLGLSKIDLSKTDIEEFEILVKVDGGVSERLIVNDGDLCLVCTMEWNIGEFKYYDKDGKLIKTKNHRRFLFW